MTSLPTLAYGFRQQLSEGQTRTFVETFCSRCPDRGSFRWPGANNPHHIAAKFQKLGWDFDPYRQGRNLCPNCNPHYKSKRFNNSISLPDGHKTPGERFTWMRARLQLHRTDIANEAHIDERRYRDLEDDRIGGFHDLHTTAAKVVPVIRRHGFPITLRWVLGLPETGSVLGLNLKAAMAARSVTTGFLSSETHIAPSVIESILSGNMASFFRLDDLAKHLHTTGEVLLCDVAPLPKDAKEKLPKPPAVVEPAPVVELPKDRAGIVARRLKSKRMAEELSQADLAGRIYPIIKEACATTGTLDMGVGTLSVYLSKIERGNAKVSREVEILKACAVIFHTTPEWQCGEGDEPDAPPAEPTVALPTWAVDLKDPDDVRRQLAMLRGDHDALASLHSDLVAEAATYKGFLDEWGGRITTLEQVLSAMPMPAPVEPVAEPVVVPAPQAPAILVALPAPQEALIEGITGHTNGHGVIPLDDGIPSYIKRANIDRLISSKQNSFADMLRPHRFAEKTLTLDLLIDECGGQLDPILADAADPRSALRKLILREAAAPNGTLMQTSPGEWKLRQTLEAAE
jgi:transcriptional regulator with XRE-family HTH domain